MKRARCAKAGIGSRLVSLPAITTTAELVETLQSLSRNAEVHGILLQHPVGPHIDERAAFEAIAPEKGHRRVTMSSFVAMSFGLPGFASCTPGGIMPCLLLVTVRPVMCLRSGMPRAAGPPSGRSRRTPHNDESRTRQTTRHVSPGAAPWLTRRAYGCGWASTECTRVSNSRGLNGLMT